MRYPLLFLFLVISIKSLAQTGTAGNPYTALGQAWHVPSSGIYYFNIDATSFSTYVEKGTGWILIASGNAATTESSYSVTNTLTLQSDKILSSAIYTSALVTAVRMNATSGSGIPFDVQSSNALVLSNLKNNKTLSVGTNSGNWTGTGTALLTRGCAGNNATLATHIYHACGNANNMHWQVGKDGHEYVILSAPSKNNLNLWIRASAVTLPIQLINFVATPVNNEIVKIHWKTSSEINNHYFNIERSIDTKNWEEIAKIDSKGATSSYVSYTAVDHNPYSGTSYYRLKQTDVDGHFEYSEFITVNLNEPSSSYLKIIPNPAIDKIMLHGVKEELNDYCIYNLVGENVTHHTKILAESESFITIDISELISGTYIVKTISSVSKIYKE